MRAGRLWRQYYLIGAILARDMRKPAKRPRPNEASGVTLSDNSANGWGHRLWRCHGWRVLTLLALVVAAYSNSFHAGLVFDNAGVIVDDPRIRAATLQNCEFIMKGGYWYINATSGLYRPLTTFSYLLNYSVIGNGLHPLGYHLVNLALHATNVILTYALGLVIFEEASLALAVAGIWGLHPLLTESVTNIVGRADLLAAFGVLAGLLCYVKAEPAVRRKRLVWFLALGTCQTIGIFSKENAIILPAILLLYTLTWSERTAWRPRVSGCLALALPFAAFFYLRGWLQAHMLIDYAENPLVGTDFWTARLTAVKVIGKFLWLFVWPVRLSVDYSYNAIPLFGWRTSNWEDIKTFISVSVVLGSAVLAFLLVLRWRRTERPLLFFLVFFYIALFPTSNLVVPIGSIMAERFAYLPAVGLAGCVVGIIHVLHQRHLVHQTAVAQFTWVAVGSLCILFTTRTYARNFDWQDDLSLWTSTVQVCPASARPHYNLGRELQRLPGRLPDAIAEYQAALRIRPDHADAHNNLGNALAAIPGRLPEAIAEYQAALRIRPDDADAHNNLGNALATIPGRLLEAVDEYRAAVRSQPDHPKAHTNLANVLARIPGRLPEAVAEYQAALRIEPGLAQTHNDLANVLARIPGRLPEAIAEYESALRIEPDRAEGHYNLGNALAQVPGGLPEAITQYQAALRTEPDFTEAHVNLGNALARMPGRLQDAIAEYKTALRIDPELEPAHYNLGNVLMQVPGRHREAISEYEAALRIKPDPQLEKLVRRLRLGR